MSQLAVVIIDSHAAVSGLEYMLSRLGMPRSDIEEITIQVLDLLLEDYEHFNSNLQTLPDVNRIVVVPEGADLQTLKLAVVTMGNTLHDLMIETGIRPVLDENGIMSLPVAFNSFLDNNIVLNYLHQI